MMRKILLGITLAVLFGAVKAQVLSEVTIELERDGVGANKSSYGTSLNIYFVNVEDNCKTIISPVLTGNSFVMPSCLQSGQSYFIVVKFGKHYISLGSHVIEMNQSMRWTVGVDKKPFSQSYPIDESLKDQTKGVVYIIFHPLTKGEGHVVMQTINDFKIFYRDSRRLVQPN